jgi:hypothetical protein
MSCSTINPMISLQQCSKLPFKINSWKKMPHCRWWTACYSITVYVSSPFLELIGTTTSSLEALATIEEGNVNLVYGYSNADLTGLQLSKLCWNQYYFTTAHPQFVRCKGSWCDWLLAKPFEFERFYEAVLVKIVVNLKQKQLKRVLYMFSDWKIFWKVYVKDICYIEGLKNYVAIHLNDKQIITNNTFKEYWGFFTSFWIY